MDRQEKMWRLETELKLRFGVTAAVKFFRAPGRVDLMGSHTDYNDGHILAATVDREMLAAASARDDRLICFYSLNTEKEVRVSRDQIVFAKEHGWANYPKGVIKELLERRVSVPGFNFVVHGDIPVGGNLSSSAALEAATCEAGLGMAKATLPAWDKVKLCKQAENEFMGLPCGIMDQFTVIMGGQEKALLLDCRSLAFEAIPFAGERAVLVVIDSGLGRELVAGKYAERVKQCQAAVAVLASHHPKIKALRDAGLEDLERARTELGDVLYRRAYHVVSEDLRVIKAGEAMKAGDLAGLGRIMEEGYQSCRDGYENSTPELDLLHDLAGEGRGVFGVRICGAGWGGCLLALVEKDKALELGPAIAEKYREKTGRQVQTWVVTPSPGAGPV